MTRLHLRNPQDLHPTRWLGWVQAVTRILLRTANLSEIAGEIGVSYDALLRATKTDWKGDEPDPWVEGEGRPGRPPKAFVGVVEALARHLGHDCDLRRYRVYEEIRYLLQYDETEVSYREWAAWIMAHRQFLGIPSKSRIKAPMSAESVRRHTDAIGMCGDLAAEIYTRQESMYTRELVMADTGEAP